MQLPKLFPKRCNRAAAKSAFGVLSAPLPNSACKKKLYKFRPKEKEQEVEQHVTKKHCKTVKADPISLERGVRQMLADKISGTHVGLWLLIPEHLRLGTWELLKAWSGIHDNNALQPRLALQKVHESALCVNGIRERRTLRQKGFETLNGLPFVATDQAIYDLLEGHTIAEASSLQLALGQIRQVLGHYAGRLVLIDPHRIKTTSKRQMQLRKEHTSEKASKVMQTFFAVDGDTHQPFGLGIGSSAVTATQAALPLVEQLANILPEEALVIADKEHFTVELLNALSKHPKFTFLMPVPRHKNILNQIPAMKFTPLWAGYAAAEGTYELAGQNKTSLRLIMQRTGEREDAYQYQPFVTSSGLPAEELMTLIFPKRWHIEEFFNTESALGWNRASTHNLNIRFARFSLALIAQAATYGLRQKLPEDIKNWNAQSLAQKLFAGIDGDIKVRDDTIIVTLYNAPNYLKERYENLPEKLLAEKINPKIPWLYDFKLDFRFR